MSLGRRLARFALIAAVSAAVGAATLPTLLRQATPTEEAIARVALPPPHPSESAKPEGTKPEVTKPEATKPEVTKLASVAAAPLAVSPQADAVVAAPPTNAEPVIVPPPPAVVASIPAAAEPPPVLVQAEPPPAPTAAPIASSVPAATMPTAAAAPEPFPAVQPLTIDDAANVSPPAEQPVPAANVQIATASLFPPTGKPAARKHVAGNGANKRRYARPRPFSIRELLASLHLR